MLYFATPSLLTTNIGAFSGKNIVKYRGSTVGCTEKTGGIKVTNM